MSAQLAVTRLTQTQDAIQGGGMRRLALFIAFLFCAVAVLFLGSSFFTTFWTNKNLVFQGSLSVIFLLAAIWCQREERLRPYSQAAYAFFMASFATVVTLLIGSWSRTLLAWFGLSDTTSPGMAVAKLYETAMICVPIVVLTKLSGASLRSIYLQRGNLKWGLSIGTLVFFNFAGSAFLFFATRFTSADALGAALIWGLVFSIANGFMEELWLRGILLRPLQGSLGLGGAVLLTSIVFAAIHATATYLPPIAIPFYVANTFTLGLACGYLTNKTGSLWGATLIHAASDLFLFIAVLASV